MKDISAGEERTYGGVTFLCARDNAFRLPVNFNDWLIVAWPKGWTLRKFKYDPGFVAREVGDPVGPFSTLEAAIAAELVLHNQHNQRTQ